MQTNLQNGQEPVEELKKVKLVERKWNKKTYVVIRRGSKRCCRDKSSWLVGANAREFVEMDPQVSNNSYAVAVSVFKIRASM